MITEIWCGWFKMGDIYMYWGYIMHDALYSTVANPTVIIGVINSFTFRGVLTCHLKQQSPGHMICASDTWKTLEISRNVWPAGPAGPGLVHPPIPRRIYSRLKWWCPHLPYWIQSKKNNIFSLNTKRHLQWGLSEVALSFGFGILPRMDLT